MNSWIMRRWLETHKKEEYPDLSITQENDAFHVLPEGGHPSEESIMRMCSSEFFSKHKYKYVESPMNIKLDQTFEDCRNPLPSPPYEEPVLRQSQACAAKNVARNEDIALAYAYAVNEEGYGNKRNPSFSIHNKNKTCIPMGTENQCPRENRGNQVDMTEKRETQNNQSKTESQEQEGDEEDIDGANAQSSDLENNENVIHEEVPKQDQKAPKKALVKDSVHLKNASLTIHDKKPTRIAKEKGYQFFSEHRLNQADLTEKDEEQSYHYWKTELYHGQKEEEEVYELITPSSDLEHYEKAITPSSDLEHYEMAILGEVPKKDQKVAKIALVKDSVNLKNASLTIHDKKPTRIAKEKGYQFSSEHRLNQADLTEKDEEQSYHYWKTELYHGQEEKEEVYEFITPSSDLEHYETAILGDVPQQDQNAAKHALVKDSINLKNASLTIHDKKPTRITKEKGYQFLTKSQHASPRKKDINFPQKTD